MDAEESKMRFCRAKHRHTQIATKEQSGKHNSDGKHRMVQEAIICMKMNVLACHIVICEITMREVDGHTARKAVMVRSCGKRLPLLSGSSIKWEMHPVFSVSESLSLLAKFTRVADFLKITCLRGLASLHIHNPLRCTNKWNQDLKEQRPSEYLGLRSRCEFSTDETRFGLFWYFLTVAKVRLCAV